MRELLTFSCKRCGKVTSTTNQNVFNNKICWECRNNEVFNKVDSNG